MITNDSSLFGDKTKRLKLITYNNSAYETSKKVLAYRFMEALHLNVKLNDLTKLVHDPENPSVQIEQFYISCRGTMLDWKRLIVNACLTQLSLCLVKAGWVAFKFETPLQFAEAQYQPNVVAKMLRTLFSFFKTKGVHFSLSKDFNGTGKFIYVL